LYDEAGNVIETREKPRL